MKLKLGLDQFVDKLNNKGITMIDPEQIKAFTELIKAINTNLKELIEPLGMLFGLLTLILGTIFMFINKIINKYKSALHNVINTAIDDPEIDDVELIKNAKEDLSVPAKKVIDSIIKG